MTIEVFVDDIDSVDEGLRDDYVKGDDGRYVLKGLSDMLSGYVKVDDIEKHEKTQGLVSALDKERESRRDAERKARELEEKSAGITEEEKKELAALRAAREEAEDKRRRSEGEFDRWRDDIAAKHEAETKGLVEENQKLKSIMVDDRVGREISDAMNEFGGRSTILEPLIRKFVQAGIEDDGIQIAVTDPDGVRLLDEQGAPLTIKGYVERMSTDKDFGDLFASKMKSGGGSGDAEATGGTADPGADAQGQARLKELSELANPSPKERLEMARLRGTAPTTEQLKKT
jgi:hypothetical protein